MQAKLHIFNVLEVEGSEELVLKIYQDAKDRLSKQKPYPAGASVEQASEVAQETPFNENIQEENKRARRAKSTVQNAQVNFTYVDELWTGQAGPEFKAAYARFEDPKSHPKYVTLFLHILKNDLKIEKLTINHLYTCYRLAGVKLPKHLKVAVADAKKKAWVIDDWENLRPSPIGEDAVTHDFTKKVAA